MKRLFCIPVKHLFLLLAFTLIICPYGYCQSAVEIENEDLGATDLYRMEVAVKVSKNWEFSGAPDSEGKTVASIFFTILPDGEIKNINFLKKSGNPELDKAAHKAIKKTSQTMPFPNDVKEQEVLMGLMFDYNGVK